MTERMIYSLVCCSIGPTVSIGVKPMPNAAEKASKMNTKLMKFQSFFEVTFRFPLETLRVQKSFKMHPQSEAFLRGLILRKQ